MSSFQGLKLEENNPRKASVRRATCRKLYTSRLAVTRELIFLSNIKSRLHAIERWVGDWGVSYFYWGG